MPTETKACGQPADYRYTWPGAPEDYVCYEHGRAIARIAHAMGFYLPLIVLTPKDGEHTCMQHITPTNNITHKEN